MNHPLEKKLKIVFKNSLLLKRALTHRSYLNEHPGEKLASNERLEFLGDAVLEFLVSQFIYQQFPHYPEGKLTNLRSKLVCDRSLAKIAKRLEIGEHLLLSRGEEESGGRENLSLLANAFEALIGAIFLDQGLTAANSFLESYLFPTIEEAKNYRDYKSDFQEQAQEQFRITPTYRILKTSGPDHGKIFTVGVFLAKKPWGRGVGKSKQAAEQAAARHALNLKG